MNARDKFPQMARWHEFVEIYIHVTMNIGYDYPVMLGRHGDHTYGILSAVGLFIPVKISENDPQVFLPLDGDFEFHVFLSEETAWAYIDGTEV